MKKIIIDIVDRLISLKVKARRRMRPFVGSEDNQPWRIKKVLFFREGADGCYDERDFVDFGKSFDMTIENVSDVVNSLGWERWKMEIRYVHHNTKYRAVYRSLDQFAWPPVSSSDKGSAMSPPDLLLSAQVSNVPSANVEGMYDATKRIKKYEGPRRDFGGRTLYCHDIFPMDDPDALARQFGKLVLVSLDCSLGRIVTKSVDFSKNEPIFFAT